MNFADLQTCFDAHRFYLSRGNGGVSYDLQANEACNKAIAEAYLMRADTLTRLDKSK